MTWEGVRKKIAAGRFHINMAGALVKEVLFHARLILPRVKVN